MRILYAVGKGVACVILIPAFIVLKLIEWLCSLAQAMSGWIFRLIGLLMLVTVFFSWGFQLEDSQELIRMSIAGITVFLLPMIGELLIAGVMVLELLVKRILSW